MNFCKSLCFSVSLLLVLTCAAFSQSQAERPRVVPSQPTETLPAAPTVKTPNQTTRIPTLTNRLVVQTTTTAPLVKKTVSAQPTNIASTTQSTVKNYSPAFIQKMTLAMQSRIGIPYRYGSDGPNSYDCSGLVWSIFRDAGFAYERSSARTLWQNTFAVEGDDRYKFGTLVFFNRLGHIGIVVSDKGFYHASSSKGVTYSSFDGYWSKRIVGFRRLSVE